MIDKQELMKKLRTHCPIDPLKESSRISQMKLAKLIYANREIRDIRKFIREKNDILKKSKSGGEDQKKLKTQPTEKNGRYDENQLKQLKFQMPSVIEKFLQERDKFYLDLKSINVPSMPSINSKRQTTKNKFVQLGKEAYKRRPTNLDLSAYPGHIRMKSLTFISENQKSAPPANEPLSPLKIRNKKNTFVTEPQELKICLKEEQIQKALTNLINLIKTEQSKYFFIPREFIFKLLEDRYKLNKQKSANVKTFQQIVQQSKKNKYYNPQIDRKFALEIPFCQFASFKDSKTSIDRIFNLPLKAAQRIAFKIYDRNGNGIIDEKDIIQLLSLSEQFEAMQLDMDIIVKNYKVSGRNSLNSERGEIRMRAATKSPPRTIKISDGSQSTFSIQKLMKRNNSTNQNSKAAEEDYLKFSLLENFFTFKESKQEFFKQKVKAPTTTAITLNFQDFQLAFGNKRPQIYYDLLNYLFGLDSQQIYEKVVKTTNQLRNMNRFTIYNTDGKSQSGSNYNMQTELEMVRKQSKVNEKQISRRPRLQSFSKQTNPRKISKIIGKAKSIQKFQTLKYS